MPNMAELFIDCHNSLAEGPIWHFGRNQLFWVDIVNNKMFCADSSGRIVDQWAFDEPVAAAAIIDDKTLLLASASALLKFDIASGAHDVLHALESDNSLTRANDSRVDRQGGFWIGTMDYDGKDGAGAVYHYKNGQLETLFDNIGIPNATCFSPDGSKAYWADTPSHIIQTCDLDIATGKPSSPWRPLIDTKDHRGAPDGAVTDSEGYIWSARWGGNCVVRHAPDGTIDQIVELPTDNVTCPAFGDEDLRTLYITTARAGLSDDQLKSQPHAGSIFKIRVDVPGLRETPVIV